MIKIVPRSRVCSLNQNALSFTISAINQRTDSVALQTGAVWQGAEEVVVSDLDFSMGEGTAAEVKQLSVGQQPSYETLGASSYEVAYNTLFPGSNCSRNEMSGSSKKLGCKIIAHINCANPVSLSHSYSFFLSFLLSLSSVCLSIDAYLWYILPEDESRKYNLAKGVTFLWFIHVQMIHQILLKQ